MGSGSAPNELPTPSSVSGPRFGDRDSISFERTTLRVGRYRVLSELGRGGMSNVYLAVAQGPGGVNKLVVLKALLPDLSTEPYALAMFLDEARLAAQLNHPNVVQTYEVGTEGDRHVIVMEYLEGQSLSGVVRRSENTGAPLGLALHLRIILNSLEGLHYAHELCAYDGSELKLVHRDISPQNVFVTYDGQVKVLDFGIAKASTSSTHTATGIVKGKIAYMAPEQIIGDAIDRRADLYSVGCMLWAAAAGRKLWKDTPDVHIMRRAINGEVPDPQSVNPGCDDELNRIVKKALATEPNERYQTALELQHDLELYCERLGQPVKQKDLGRYVSDLFAETRAELKGLVERQLTLIQADDSSGSRDFTPTLDRKGRDEPSRPLTSSLPTKVAGPLPAKRRTGWWLALGALALLGGGYLVSRGGASETPKSEAPKSPPPAAPAAAPAAPERVSVVLHAVPAEAKLFLDGEALPSNPTTKLLAPDGKPHALRAEAPGFSDATTEFAPTRDTTIELSLARAPQAPEPRVSTQAVRPTGKSGRPSASAGQPASGASAQAASPKSDCSESPFFLDKDGIRRLRPECR